MKTQFIAILACSLIITGCSKAQTNTTTSSTSTSDTSSFAKGADIGWLSQMEASGIQFYNSNGQQQDCIAILKSKNINSIRLRVWVNPAGGWCGTSDIIKQAVRASNMGMKILIDFHYSDYWADPGKQNKPKAWASLDFNSLVDTIYTYTKNVLTQLKNNNVIPDWVQIGNETNDGMLWETGRASTSMSNFAAMINAGYKAVKEVNSSTKVIVHISNGYDNNLFRWMFDGLTKYNAQWDVIGMSLYPPVASWQSTTTQCLVNMNDMINRYGKEIMICEIGMDVTQPDACKQFITDIIQKVKSLPNHKGLGVFYWEPECHNNWQGYNMGAFDNSGKPTVAMDGFAN
ncbi:MAG: glycosyl hydrolase 53 family protein [Bacteroidota bacterium]|nr:glycosyl hydrolase 53 family protein [Bacteroidota bacterium]